MHLPTPQGNMNNMPKTHSANFDSLCPRFSTSERLLVVDTSATGAYVGQVVSEAFFTPDFCRSKSIHAPWDLAIIGSTRMRSCNKIPHWIWLPNSRACQREAEPLLRRTSYMSPAWRPEQTSLQVSLDPSVSSIQLAAGWFTYLFIWLASKCVVFEGKWKWYGAVSISKKESCSYVKAPLTSIDWSRLEKFDIAQHQH